jgi:hypothetical protein
MQIQANIKAASEPLDRATIAELDRAAQSLLEKLEAEF